MLLRHLAPVVPLVLATGCLQAAEPGQPATPGAGFNPAFTLAPLVEAVQPAVVTVYVSSMIQLDPRLQIFGMPTEQRVEGQGSGFVISADGYILTNRHVAGDADDIKVKFPDGLDVPAKVVGVDDMSDVALLKIDAGRPLPYLRLADEGRYRVGDWVIAVGNPLGLGHTVTSGIVSGVGRDIPRAPLEQFIQTDAAINQGNSGGPLIAMDGSVIGMNTAIIQGANTVGFAIPSDHLQGVVRQIRENGKVTRGYMGVEMATIPAVAQRAIGKGVLLESVAHGGPASKAGLQAGDLVTKVGDTAVLEAKDLLRAVSKHAPGDKIKVVVVREGKERTFEVVLAERPAAGQAPRR